MYNVLIVEDDPMVAMINEQYVCRNKNFKVVKSCRNGQEALEYLDNNTVDLIIMDVFMPYMDGIEALKKISERRLIPKLLWLRLQMILQRLKKPCI